MTVDRRTVPQDFVHFLDLMSTVRFFEEYKQRSFAMLELDTATTVLDVGCGTGEDVRAIADILGPGGRVVGVDLDGTLIRTAEERSAGRQNTAFRHADAHRLPFDDASFDACRADRMLVHAKDPALVVTELTRVCRPGGVVVIVEPDYGTLVVDSDQPELTDVIVDSYTRSFAAPHAARTLPRLCRAAGLTDLGVSAETFVITDFELAAQVFELRSMPDHAVRSGRLSTADGQAWLAGLERLTAHSGLFTAITGFGIRARKPPATATTRTAPDGTS